MFVNCGASLDDLRATLRAAGARPRHETLALRAWTRGLPLDALAQREDSQFPRRLQDELPALAARFAALVTVRTWFQGTHSSRYVDQYAADVSRVLLRGTW